MVSYLEELPYLRSWVQVIQVARFVMIVRKPLTICSLSVLFRGKFGSKPVGLSTFAISLL